MTDSQCKYEILILGVNWVGFLYFLFLDNRAKYSKITKGSGGQRCFYFLVYLELGDFHNLILS